MHNNNNTLLREGGTSVKKKEKKKETRHRDKLTPQSKIKGEKRFIQADKAQETKCDFIFCLYKFNSWCKRNTSMQQCV